MAIDSYRWSYIFPQVSLPDGTLGAGSALAVVAQVHPACHLVAASQVLLYLKTSAAKGGCPTGRCTAFFRLLFPFAPWDVKG